MLTIAEFNNAHNASQLAQKLNSKGIHSYVATRLTNNANKKFKLTICEEDKEETLRILFNN